MKKNKSRLISRFSWPLRGVNSKGLALCFGLECGGWRAVVIKKAPSISAQPGMRSQLLSHTMKGFSFGLLTRFAEWSE